MRRNRLIGSLVVGLAFAFLTWVMIGNNSYGRPGIGFEYLGEAITILLLPGMFAGLMVSGNVHVADIWVVASGNFIFYFGVVYFVLAYRERRKAKQSHDVGR